MVRAQLNVFNYGYQIIIVLFAHSYMFVLVFVCLFGWLVGWVVCVLCHINHVRLFNTKSWVYIYIYIYIWTNSSQVWLFLNEWIHLFAYSSWFRALLSNTESFIYTQLNGFKYCEVILIIQLNRHLFSHS